MDSIILAGEVVDTPKFSHTFMSENFYSIEISSQRLSEVYDTIPCIVPEIYAKDIKKGNKICVAGDIRSKTIDNSNKVFVFVKELLEYQKDENDVFFENAKICKEPVFRETPRGTKITDLCLAIKRPYGKTDFVRAIAWKRTAECMKRLDKGTYISVRGRLQSREYTKLDEVKTVYELSINSYDKGVGI